MTDGCVNDKDACEAEQSAILKKLKKNNLTNAILDPKIIKIVANYNLFF